MISSILKSVIVRQLSMSSFIPIKENSSLFSVNINIKPRNNLKCMSIRNVIATSFDSQRDDEVFMSRLSGKLSGIVVSNINMNNFIQIIFNF